MNVIIREAGKEDLSGILELYRQPDMDGGALSVDEAETVFEKISSYPFYKIFVAVREIEIVGTIALAILDNLGNKGAPSGLIEDFVVKTQLQGNGIGRQLILYAIDCCRQHHCYKVTLSSGLERLNAHYFYESLGLKKYGYTFLTEL